ncbi:MAG: hypothetical protein WA771_06330, partial [Chthoniobacterales bacterium]
MPQVIPETESLQVVVVGSFNPAIFHPQWFLREGLIGADDENKANIKVVAPEGTEVTIGGVNIKCLSEQLIFETVDISYTEKLFDILTSSLIKLPHTPCVACGINPRAHYRVQTEDYWHKIGHTLAPKDDVWNVLYTKPGMQAVTIKSVREGDYPGEINTTVQPSALVNPGIFVQANFHFPVLNADERETSIQVTDYLRSEWKLGISEARRV